MSNQVEMRDGYAVCKDCNQAMKPGAGCTKPFVILGQKRIARIVYKNRYRRKPHACHDCGVFLGQIHHYACDMEICPKCKEQLAFCNCIVMGVMETKESVPVNYGDRKAKLFEMIKQMKV